MSNQYQHGNLLLDPPQLQGTIYTLKEIDFELAYLAVLTCKGLKPLSRWEQNLTDDDLVLLQRIGLLTRQVRRSVRAGKKVIDTIFSRAPVYIQLYEQVFGNTPVDKSPRTQLFEGFFFGYPSCCVNEYIRKPFAPNNLNEQQQKILFHWACRDCKVTPSLLPAYKSIHDSIERL
jgi:hypothetical protein